MSKAYNERLMDYITSYVKINNIAPSMDTIISNVVGVTNKQSLHYHLQELTKKGKLEQNISTGLYYPTSFTDKIYLISDNQINDLLKLSKGSSSYTEIKTILSGLKRY